MESDRKRRWDEPAADTDEAKASEATAAAVALAQKIAASLKAGGSLTGQELVKRDEGDFIKDIEINDLRNRYVLTKGSTQKQISEDTGASVQTKGIWVPDRSKMAAGEEPLYLHIVATTQAILDAAVGKVNELINQELGPLLDERTIVARNRALGLPMPAGFLPGGRQKWPEEKLYIGLDSLRNFNIRAKTVGPGGMFVKYIQAETGARVQIKGQGSGFMETETGRESDEPMHINIAGPDQGQIDRAKELAEDLLLVLRSEYQKARDGQGGGAYAGVYQGNGTYAPQAGYGDSAAQGAQDPYAAYYAQYPQGGATPAAAGQTPQTPAPGAPAASDAEAHAAYAAYWAQYGYDVNDPAFQAWQATQYQGQAGAAAPTA